VNMRGLRIAFSAQVGETANILFSTLPDGGDVRSLTVIQATTTA